MKPSEEDKSESKSHTNECAEYTITKIIALKA